jgi:hypothetical protein
MELLSDRLWTGDWRKKRVKLIALNRFKAKHSRACHQITLRFAEMPLGDPCRLGLISQQEWVS